MGFLPQSLQVIASRRACKQIAEDDQLQATRLQGDELESHPPQAARYKLQVRPTSAPASGGAELPVPSLRVRVPTDAFDRAADRAAAMTLCAKTLCA